MPWVSVRRRMKLQRIAELSGTIRRGLMSFSRLKTQQMQPKQMVQVRGQRLHVTFSNSHTEKRFVKAAGDVWTVRYEEALALETAYQRWRLAKIEAVLAEKGITL